MASHAQSVATWTCQDCGARFTVGRALHNAYGPLRQVNAAAREHCRENPTHSVEVLTERRDVWNLSAGYLG